MVGRTSGPRPTPSPALLRDEARNFRAAREAGRGANSGTLHYRSCGFFGKLIMFAKMRYAPGTPSGNCL